MGKKKKKGVSLKFKQSLLLCQLIIKGRRMSRCYHSAARIGPWFVRFVPWISSVLPRVLASLAGDGAP